VTTKTYLDALEEGQAFFDYVYDNGGNLVEEMVAIGYRAGLTDGVRIIKDTGAANPESSVAFYAKAIDKFASLARKFEERIKQNGVGLHIKKSEGFLR